MLHEDSDAGQSGMKIQQVRTLGRLASQRRPGSERPGNWQHLHKRTHELFSGLRVFVRIPSGSLSPRVPVQGNEGKDLITPAAFSGQMAAAKPTPLTWRRDRVSQVTAAAVAWWR